jgi:hypothetical protein
VTRTNITRGAIVRVPWGLSKIEGLVVDIYGQGGELRAVVRIPAAGGYPDMSPEEIVVPLAAVEDLANTWPRDSYTGPGGGLYTGPGGGLYTGPGGGAHTGPGGGLYTGPGGGLYTGPGGGLYTGPGGGLYTGPGGGLYTGPGGGLYAGPSPTPFRSNWPTRSRLLQALTERHLRRHVVTLRSAWGASADL